VSLSSFTPESVRRPARLRTSVALCRIKAGFSTAKAGAEAIARAHRTTPGLNGCPSVSWWTRIEAEGQSLLTDPVARRAAKAFGCTLNDLRVTPVRDTPGLARGGETRRKVRGVVTPNRVGGRRIALGGRVRSYASGSKTTQSPLGGPNSQVGSDSFGKDVTK
jgi:hypothetical protein